MKAITLREFSDLVNAAGSIVTAHREALPSIELTKEQAHKLGTLVGHGARLTVHAFYLRGWPDLLLGSEEGRVVVP